MYTNTLKDTSSFVRSVIAEKLQSVHERSQRYKFFCLLSDGRETTKCTLTFSWTQAFFFSFSDSRDITKCMLTLSRTQVFLFVQ